MIAENVSSRTRYRLLETVRQYAMEKARRVRRSRECPIPSPRSLHAHGGRARRAGSRRSPSAHRAGRSRDGQPAKRIRLEPGNGDVGHALELASWLQPLWLTRGRIMEGLAWFDAALGDEDPDDADMSVERVRALADKSALAGWIGMPSAGDAAKQALSRARELDDPALVVRALTAMCCDAVWNLEDGGPYFAEATLLARELGDLWRLSQILGRQANAGVAAGDPVAMGAAGEEGLQIAEAIGDRFSARCCRWAVASAQFDAR